MVKGKILKIILTATFTIFSLSLFPVLGSYTMESPSPHPTTKNTSEDSASEISQSSSSKTEVSNSHGSMSNEDPIEDLNRGIFAFNETVDGMFLKPAALIYDMTVEPHIQDGVHNVLNNLNSPIVFMNDLLQGEGERAMETLGRFIINSTLGILGIFDPASDMIAEYHVEDFGQTLAVAGVDSGPYLMLPILGPSNPRDFLGRVVDFFADPFPYIARRHGYRGWNYTRYGVYFVDLRSRSFDIERTIYNSSDPYAMMKTLYIQNREFNIANGIVDRDSPKPSNED